MINVNNVITGLLRGLTSLGYHLAVSRKLEISHMMRMKKKAFQNPGFVILRLNAYPNIATKLIIEKKEPKYTRNLCSAGKIEKEEK